MTRRDTIIAAVLVNAGLMIVLFASALKSDSKGEELTTHHARPAEFQVDSVAHKEAAISQGDEVDQVLKQYAQPVPYSALTAQPAENISPPAEAPQQSFADDLRAITLPEIAAQPVPPATAQPASPPVAASLSTASEYKVKKGDVLEKIARHHHCTVDEIMKLNQLKTTNLRIGQALKIPSSSSGIASIAHASSPSPSSTEGPAKYYTVKNGDNPWTIAMKNHMKVEDLLKLNNLDQEKARKLKPGDQLRIN
jgi:LysM repeat protein